MAPLLNRGRLKTGDEFNQHKKRSLVFLGYHEVKAGNNFWKDVSFFFILIPNSTGMSLLLLSIDPCCFGLYRIVLRDEVETNLDR